MRRHQPRLLRRPDGRWEVLCLQCQQNQQQATPIGIGIPIANLLEAEGIARNHAEGSVSAAL
jgi:hypothetical protein